MPSRANKFITFASRVRRSLLRAHSQIDRARKIKLSRAMYFQMPSLDVTLFVGLLDDTKSMRLTLSEAAEIFRSIGDAFEASGLRSVKVGELKWTTDARGDSVVFQIVEYPMGFNRVSVSREDVAAALKEFGEKIVLKLPTTNVSQIIGRTCIASAQSDDGNPIP